MYTSTESVLALIVVHPLHRRFSVVHDLCYSFVVDVQQTAFVRTIVNVHDDRPIDRAGVDIRRLPPVSDRFKCARKFMLLICSRYGNTKKLIGQNLRAYLNGLKTGGRLNFLRACPTVTRSPLHYGGGCHRWRNQGPVNTSVSSRPSRAPSCTHRCTHAARCASLRCTHANASRSISDTCTLSCSSSSHSVPVAVG